LTLKPARRALGYVLSAALRGVGTAVRFRCYNSRIPTQAGGRVVAELEKSKSADQQRQIGHLNAGGGWGWLCIFWKIKGLLANNASQENRFLTPFSL